MFIFELIKIIIIGIVEGVTEWLPISSTGHMLLVDEFLQLDMSSEFKEMFFVVIQLGAIMAVVIIFWKKMFPFNFKSKNIIKKNTFLLWIKVCVACIPAGVIGILFDDYIEENLSTPNIIVAMLIIYGILFIVIERWNKKRRPKVRSLAEISYNTALIIGGFQTLALIPGTSRSGATIIGALIIGVSRTVAAEFSFFLAVPIMFGASLVKLRKFGFDFTFIEFFSLIFGMIIAFVVSVFTIKFLMGYIKKHDFTVFGWYRIILGIILALSFAFM